MVHGGRGQSTSLFNMASSMTTSPPDSSQPVHEKATSNPPALPPLVTNPALRRTPSNRPTSFAQRTISNYSFTSRSNPNHSRPLSQVFPAFHSSLSYTFVRDFAYLPSHPLHYGPQPDASGADTPVSEVSRRLSDPAIMGGWEDSRNQWSATPPWLGESNYNSNRDQLPAMTFNDGGPPYSEDEDIRSPIVTSKTRHRKKKSNAGERGRSPGAASQDRGMIMDVNGDQLEGYRPVDTDELDGPGGEIEMYTRPRREPYHRDSNFAKPLQRMRSPYDYVQAYQNETDPRAEVDEADEEDEVDDDDEGDEEEDEDMDEDAARFSKDYSFTIASPDEEMNGKAVVLFDFTPEHENELGLYEGQIILVSYRQARGWLVAEDPSTGESGLVPETYVRLVSQIDGGLNGLEAFDAEDNGNGVSYTSQDVMSPVSHEPNSAISTSQDDPQEALMGGHTPRPSNGGSFSSERHPAVQSTFSTSSRDFSPLKREGGGRSPERD